MKIILLAAFATLLPALAHAGTFVIDVQMGPGADFQEVQEALNSPLVVDGDTLLIRPGSYQVFVTSKSVTMEGLGAKPSDTDFLSGFSTTSSFESCASQIRLTNLEFSGLSIKNCSNPTYLIEVEMRDLYLINATQVRVENEILSTGPASFSVSVSSGSNVDFLRCNFGGEWGNSGATGGTAVTVWTGSYARFADCTVRGGNGGGYPHFSQQGGDGGVGISVSQGSQVQFIGQAGNTIEGGSGGWGADVLSDGAGGIGLLVTSASSVRLSEVLTIGGFDAPGTKQAAGFSGPAASLTTAIVPDPFLVRTGSLVPGGTASFLLSGEPSAGFIAFIGTQVTAKPLAGIIGLLATDFTSPFFPGQLDASGDASLTIAIPLAVPIGTMGTIQSGTLYTSDNSIRLSNPNTIWIQ